MDQLHIGSPAPKCTTSTSVVTKSLNPRVIFVSMNPHFIHSQPKLLNVQPHQRLFPLPHTNGARLFCDRTTHVGYQSVRPADFEWNSVSTQDEEEEEEKNAPSTAKLPPPTHASRTISATSGRPEHTLTHGNRSSV
ncbi:hypothetical protein HMN09_00820600 [Mycena chlorophos]|uniref:Uncharacterized protein n=1 Tax=Mycena chlorophos TaxID=658473 RepID=A0A8H6W4Q7_MYCCL|nr:hypothetical protein HMN09_00820600 [Mycena chlorophos]